MVATKEGFKKKRETMIAKYGSEEAYLEFMRSIGSKGGRKGKTGGYWHMKYVEKNVDKVKESGRKGGRISRRRKRLD